MPRLQRWVDSVEEGFGGAESSKPLIERCRDCQACLREYTAYAKERAEFDCAVVLESLVAVEDEAGAPAARAESAQATPDADLGAFNPGAWGSFGVQ